MTTWPEAKQNELSNDVPGTPVPGTPMHNAKQEAERQGSQAPTSKRNAEVGILVQSYVITYC